MMKKLSAIVLAATLVFGLVSFATAKDLSGKVQIPEEQMEFVPGGLPYLLFIPHFDCTPGEWWSGLVLQNMTASANQATIWIQNDKGYTVSYIEDAFTGFEKATIVLRTTETAGTKTGYIIIESQYPMIAFINYGMIGGGFTSLGPFVSYGP